MLPTGIVPLARRFAIALAGLWLATLCLEQRVFAEVRLPAVFADHMVLQRDAPIPVWGWAEPEEELTVSLGEQAVRARGGKDGAWMAQLAPLPAGGPHELVVQSGSQKVVLKDVLVGEVWLCSGQSNMAMNVSGVVNAEQEQSRAELPKIRMFTTARNASAQPTREAKGEWSVCSPESVGRFSATAFFFGKRLHEELDVPVGLLNSSWGGTAVEAWTSWEGQESLADIQTVMGPWRQRIADYDPQRAQAAYEKAMDRWKAAAREARNAGRRPPRRPTAPVDPRLNQNHPANLFNGMIQPLVPYAIRGAIWYQGERNSNGEISKLYHEQLAALIQDWRTHWGQDFPFYFVQLPNFMALQEEPVETGGWVVVQDAMRRTLEVPGTGMAITIDVGEAGDIHPKNKQAVGQRLARLALAKTYGKDLCPSGPLFKEAKKVYSSIAVSFDHTCGGLQAKGDRLQGFAIAGPDRKFVWADAKIDGDKVLVSSPSVARPVAVRYAWASNPIGNLVNADGLPASPFRTDDWPLDTQGKR